MKPGISSEPSRLAIWLLAIRPKTLPAAASPVLIGTAMAFEDGAFHAVAALCALVGALLIQIGTNFSNDYADFVKGADTHERKGPLRVTQAGLVSPAEIKRATAIVFALAFAVGLYLIYRGGWPILLVGVLSILSGILYTSGPYSLAYLGLGDLFVLIFFGPIAVGGTYYVQTLQLTGPVLAMGLGAGLLSVAILLANNIRDVEEDRRAHKRTLVVRLGRSFGVGLYGFCFVAAAAVPIALYAGERRHPFVLAAAVILPLSFISVRTLWYSRDPDRLNPVLGYTARLLLLYSVLFAIGWNL